MKSNTRACIAYIAGCLVSGKKASSVYDYSQSKHIMISGKVEKDEVQLYDHDRCCHLSGKKTGNRFSLYHYGDGHFIDFALDDPKFEGYDYGAACHYSGEVRGDSINIYDYGESSSFSYSI
jgi:hypothetical protein